MHEPQHPSALFLSLSLPLSLPLSLSLSICIYIYMHPYICPHDKWSGAGSALGLALTPIDP